MNVVVTLNPGLGAQLGPDFNLTANVGIVYPSTATLIQLLAGLTVTVLDSADIITITSTGQCTNSIELNIVECTTTTTSTTSTTSTTTTTTTVQCSQFEIIGLTGGGSWQALTCNGLTITGSIEDSETIFTGCIVTNSLVLNNASVVFEITCNQTTTTTVCPPPTLYLSSGSGNACIGTSGQLLTNITFTPTNSCNYCNYGTLSSPEITALAPGTYYVSDGVIVRTWTKAASPTNLFSPSECTTCYDSISGSFTVSNSMSSYTTGLVNLGGFGTGATVAIGSFETLSPTGQILYSTSASFVITSSDGTGIVTVLADTLACTNATVVVTGSGTTTVTITVTPINYNESVDVMSGDITVGISPV